MRPVRFVIRTTLKVITAITCVLTLLSAYGGHISPYIWSAPSVLTLMLPYFAALMLAGIACWALARSITGTLMCVITLAICWPPIATACPWGGAKTPGENAKTFKLLTYNIIHGWNEANPDDNSYPGFRYILDEDPDIVCMQELVDFSQEELPDFPATLRDSLFSRYPYRLADAPNDLTILSKFPVAYARRGQIISHYRMPFDVYQLSVYGRKLTIINAHLASYSLSSKERGLVTGISSVGSARKSIDEFKTSILSKMRLSFRKRADDTELMRSVLDKTEGAVIVCGDFNDVPESWAYRTVMGDDMKDAYTETCFGPAITYNKHLFFFHIDQILYRGPLRALSVEKGDIKTSDHYPLTAVFEFTKTGDGGTQAPETH